MYRENHYTAEITCTYIYIYIMVQLTLSFGISHFFLIMLKNVVDERLQDGLLFLNEQIAT